MASKTVFRVLVWNTQTLMWVIGSEKNNPYEAQQVVNKLKAKGTRARIQPAERKVLEIKPPVISPTRQHRAEQAGQMSDTADAKKYYKSPG